MFQVLCWALVTQRQASHDIAGKGQNINSQHGSEKDGAVPCLLTLHLGVVPSKWSSLGMIIILMILAFSKTFLKILLGFCSENGAYLF